MRYQIYKYDISEYRENNMNISYDYYRVFYYVAKYRSFTYAANALFTNQPNVTRCIRLLEHALGCRLFLRSNRGVKLTPEGEQLFSHVSAAVSQLETAESELRSSVDPRAAPCPSAQVKRHFTDFSSINCVPFTDSTLGFVCASPIIPLHRP